MSDILLLIAGLFIGTSFGAVGAGGAVLSIPALVMLGGQSMHQAIAGGPVMVVVMGAATAIQDFRRSGKAQTLARLKTSLSLGLPGLPGALAGAWVSHQAPAVVLKLVFLVLVAWAAWKMVMPPLPCVDDEGDGKAAKLPVAALFAGLGLGFLSGLLGIGGGFLAVPILVLLFGYCTGPAARISVLLVLLNGLWSFLSHLIVQGLEIEGMKAVLFLLIGGLIGIPAGLKIRTLLEESLLRKGFAAVLVLAALLMQLR